jgi:hypothetical protein
MIRALLRWFDITDTSVPTDSPETDEIERTQAARLVHLQCCRYEDRALCGAVLTELAPGVKADCLVCDDMHPRNQDCPGCGQPWFCTMGQTHCQPVAL